MTSMWHDITPLRLMLRVWRWSHAVRHEWEARHGTQIMPNDAGTSRCVMCTCLATVGFRRSVLSRFYQVKHPLRTAAKSHDKTSTAACFRAKLQLSTWPASRNNSLLRAGQPLQQHQATALWCPNHSPESKPCVKLLYRIQAALFSPTEAYHPYVWIRTPQVGMSSRACFFHDLRALRPCHYEKYSLPMFVRCEPH